MRPGPRTNRPLSGSRCARCGHVAYPGESVCSACGRRDEHRPFQLTPEGTLYTFTIVHAAAPGVETPYALGYVDLVDGPRLFGRIASGDQLAVGIKVWLVPGPDGRSDEAWFEAANPDGGSA